MDRYFHAFETSSMPEDTCAPRIAVLGEETKALQARASELAAQSDEQPGLSQPPARAVSNCSGLSGARSAEAIALLHSPLGARTE
jgi:hypothetical protein